MVAFIVVIILSSESQVSVGAEAPTIGILAAPPDESQGCSSGKLGAERF